MSDTADLFVSLAELAGIFVGFGALISITREGPEDPVRMGRLRGVVIIGLLTIVAALLPVALERYGLSGRGLWGLASGLFLVLIWGAVGLPLVDPAVRSDFWAGWRANPGFSLFFWVVLEVPIQVPLVLAMLGIAPTLGAAFYTTALVLNLFEAAALLVLVVYKGAQSTLADP